MIGLRLHIRLASVTGLISGVTDNVAVVGVTETGEHVCVQGYTDKNESQEILHSSACQPDTKGRTCECVCGVI